MKDGSIKVEFILILLVFAVLCMPVFGQTTEKEWLDQGNDSFRQGKYDEAIQAYDKAIEINPKDVEAWIGKGRALTDQGKYNESRGPFVQGQYNEGRALTDQGQYNEGYALTDQSKYNESIQAFDKAIEIRPKDSGPWDDKGRLLSDLGKYNESIQAYDKAIEINPKDADARLHKDIALKALAGATLADATIATEKEELGYSG